MKKVVERITEKYFNDPYRLIDILIDVQEEIGYLPEDIVKDIAFKTGLSTVDVEQTISFYHFFSDKPTGKYSIYLNDSAVANMHGRLAVKEAFEEAVGCKFGSVSTDGLIGLFDTACIGMNDQEPAAIINDIVFTKLTPYRAKEIIKDIKRGKKIDDIIYEGFGDGKNSSDYVKAMVYNNIRKKGPILDDEYTPGQALEKAVDLSPEDVINEIKMSNIRGRGGAGFPTGLKWQFCRNTDSDERYVFCNADEGEPGTFKDRVILTERPRLIFEGMALAGYAINAKYGILYLRYEYKYLERHLENVLQELRNKNLLGKNILGHEGFDFDIRIQFGAGAYVCGEESALIESAEGKRGEPRDRPPFPVEKGYKDKPTIVNNVETLCSAVKVILNGGQWYKSFGTKDSTGTKLLSISGDCRYPGVYEVEWGFSVNDMLEMVGADQTQAVQVGGPSGSLIAPNEFDRTLSYSDLSTGGSMIIIGKHRDILKEVVLNFTNFFIDESCGSCVPCRYLTKILQDKLVKIINGRGVRQDLEDIITWSKTMKSNRCGLGQTAINPIKTSIKNFRHLYEDKLQKNVDYDSGFDLNEAVKDACLATGRSPIPSN